MIVLNLLRLMAVVALGFLFGKLASKLKMPAVLGFLIVGMALGPNAANLLTQEILDAPSYVPYKIGNYKYKAFRSLQHQKIK